MYLLPGRRPGVPIGKAFIQADRAAQQGSTAATSADHVLDLDRGRTSKTANKLKVLPTSSTKGTGASQQQNSDQSKTAVRTDEDEDEDDDDEDDEDVSPGDGVHVSGNLVEAIECRADPAALKQFYDALSHIPAGSARRDAMRLTKTEKARLPRVTAYCTAA